MLTTNKPHNLIPKRETNGQHGIFDYVSYRRADLGTGVIYTISTGLFKGAWFSLYASLGSTAEYLWR